MNAKRNSVSTMDTGRKGLGISLGGLAISAVLLALITGIALAIDAFVPINDVDGANDEPNQKDLTKLEVDDSHAGVVHVTWNWDEVTGFSGNNTGDACALYDTDGDGLVNYALCVTIEDDAGGIPVQTSDSPRLYSCDEFPPSVANRRCTSSVLIAAPYDSAAIVVSPSATDPFPAGGDYPNDTQAITSFDFGDISDPPATLLNVCSYPSQIPNSDPSDCIVTPGSGFLTIVKVNTVLSDTTPFTFTASAASLAGPSSWTINGSGSVQLIPYAPTTTLDLNEAIPSLWQLDAASCEIQPSTSTGTPDALPFAGPASKGVQNLTIQSGLETICTFNDSLRRREGTLIVIKMVINDNGGLLSADDFDFSVNGGTAQPFEADGENHLTVDAGFYTITEPAVVGYTTSYDNCTNIEVPDGGSATCTITNDDDAPSLTLDKVVVNDNGGTAAESDWTLDAAGPTPLSGPGAAGNTDVVSGPSFDQGTYTLSETGGLGTSDYTASAWVCVGGTQAGSDITVGLGESATCTITNDDISPTITIIKNTHGTPTEFTFNIVGPSSSAPSITPVGDPGTGTTGPIEVDAGSYTVDEQGPPPGWTLTDITCDAGSAGPDTNADGIPNSWNFTLALGDHVTCTFTDSAVLTTRTQGFWATHTGLANAVWNGTSGAPAGSTPVIGSGDEFLCGREITAIAAPGQNILMGGFWSNIARTSDRIKRSALDQARMQMLQQYLAAVLNVHAFGSGSPTLLSNARAAYCGISVSAIKTQIGILGAFNSSGDSQAFTPGASATAQLSREQADIGFWDATT